MLTLHCHRRKNDALAFVTHSSVFIVIVKWFLLFIKKSISFHTFSAIGLMIYGKIHQHGTKRGNTCILEHVHTFFAFCSFSVT